MIIPAGRHFSGHGRHGWRYRHRGNKRNLIFVITYGIFTVFFFSFFTFLSSPDVPVQSHEIIVKQVSANAADSATDPSGTLAQYIIIIKMIILGLG